MKLTSKRLSIILAVIISVLAVAFWPDGGLEPIETIPIQTPAPLVKEITCGGVPAPSGLAMVPAAATSENLRPVVVKDLIVTTMYAYLVIEAKPGDRFVFGAGTSPNSNDLRGWQVTIGEITNPQLKLADFHKLGIRQGDKIWLNVARYDGTTGPVTSKPFTFHWKDAGLEHYTLLMDYSRNGRDGIGEPVEGWTDEEIAIFDGFLSDAIPVMKEIIGPPAYDDVVYLQKDLSMTGINVYLAGSTTTSRAQSPLNGGLNPKLLVHEIAHAFDGSYIFGTDQDWSYQALMAPYTEGLAEAYAILTMKELARRYPEKYAGKYDPWLSIYYDQLNTPQMKVKNFWHMQGAMLKAQSHYSLSAYAWLKVHEEKNDIFKNVRANYFNLINFYGRSDGLPRPVEEEQLIAAFNAEIWGVEGVPYREFIDQNYVLQVGYDVGPKLWLLPNSYRLGNSFDWYFRCFPYVVEDDGNSWSNRSGKYIHQLNGVDVSVDIYKGDTLVFTEIQKTEPLENPPAFNGVASLEVGISNNYDPDGELYINTLNGPKINAKTLPDGLLTFRASYFYEGKEVVQEMSFVNGVKYAIPGSLIGLVPGIKKDVIGDYVLCSHEKNPTKVDSLQVEKDLFFSSTAPGPGKLFVTYVNGRQRVERIKNIGGGDSQGGQMLTFDFEYKEPEVPVCN